MTKLVSVVAMLLGAPPNTSVTACGNAVCVSVSPTPVTLGGTVQVSQGPWPDGGLAGLTPVIAGASIALCGTQADPVDGGTIATPDVVLRGKNSRSDKDVIVSMKSNTTEVARFGNQASIGRLLDGGTQTATVPLNTHCVCNDITDVTKGSKGVVSTNTATLSGTTGDQLYCLCF